MQNSTGFGGVRFSLRLSSADLVCWMAFSRFFSSFLAKFPHFLLQEPHLLVHLVIVHVSKEAVVGLGDIADCLDPFQPKAGRNASPPRLAPRHSKQVGQRPSHPATFILACPFQTLLTRCHCASAVFLCQPETS